MALVIISPHCDDAALSLGGFIKESKERIRIITCFNISNYAVYSKNLSQYYVSNLRKKEDNCFLTLCGPGVTLEYLDMIEAPLRKERNTEELINQELNENPNLDGFEYVIDKIEDGLAEIA